MKKKLKHLRNYCRIIAHLNRKYISINCYKFKEMASHGSRKEWKRIDDFFNKAFPIDSFQEGIFRRLHQCGGN